VIINLTQLLSSKSSQCRPASIIVIWTQNTDFCCLKPPTECLSIATASSHVIMHMKIDNPDSLLSPGSPISAFGRLDRTPRRMSKSGDSTHLCRNKFINRLLGYTHEFFRHYQNPPFRLTQASSGSVRFFHFQTGPFQFYAIRARKAFNRTRQLEHFS
jgi:hypothetical protein